MPKVMLLISKIWRDSTHMQVKCTLSPNGSVQNAAVSDRFFCDPSELEDALRAAGVAEADLCAPHHVFNNGLPTFIPISLEVAKRLGVLV